MKASILIALTLAMAVAVAADEPEVIDNVDFTMYEGTWYQISDYRQFYEVLCNRCVQAQYTLEGEGQVHVENTGHAYFSILDRFCGVTGTAKVVDPNVPAKLSLQFDFPKNKGNYWILALGALNEDGLYSWSLVSDPSRKTLYVLARTPSIDDDEYQNILSIARGKGFDTSKLTLTEQADCKRDTTFEMPSFGFRQ